MGGNTENIKIDNGYLVLVIFYTLFLILYSLVDLFLHSFAFFSSDFRETIGTLFNLSLYAYIIVNVIMFFKIITKGIQKKSLWVPGLFFISGLPLLLLTLVSIAFWGVDNEFLYIIKWVFYGITRLILVASGFFAYKLYRENKLSEL